MPDPRQTVAADAAPEPDPRTWTTPAIVRGIAAHHASLRRSLPSIEGLMLKVARVHGAHDPRLWELEDVVRELIELLEPRLEREEAELLPAMLAEDRNAVAAELAEMGADHDVIAALLERARAATDGFQVPDWACSSFRALHTQLAALDDDLQRCLRLERGLLAPRFAAGPG